MRIDRSPSPSSTELVSEEPRRKHHKEHKHNHHHHHHHRHHGDDEHHHRRHSKDGRGGGHKTAPRCPKDPKYDHSCPIQREQRYSIKLQAQQQRNLRFSMARGGLSQLNGSNDPAKKEQVNKAVQAAQHRSMRMSMAKMGGASNQRESLLSLQKLSLAILAEEEQQEEHDEKKWVVEPVQFYGTLGYDDVGKQEIVKGKSIKKAIELIKEDPQKYSVLFFQKNMLQWPVKHQEYTLIHREGTVGLRVYDASPTRGNITCYQPTYQALPALPDNELASQQRDSFTDSMTFHKRPLTNPKVLPHIKPILPGRGMGHCDTPQIALLGQHVDPWDVRQGKMGDCWLMSGLACLAEFGGAIRHLFRKTPQLDQRPLAEPNMYTITLWDLEHSKEVDIEVDERLAVKADGTLMGCKPSTDEKLWVCYVEKAMSIHCGGWDNLCGGLVNDAWTLLTGYSKAQYLIRPSERQDSKFQCLSRYNPRTKKHLKQCNNPHENDQSVTRVPWPKVGGGGSLDLTAKQVFQRLCEWDDHNFLLAAGGARKEEDAGLVANHAYSILSVHDNVCNTGIGLIQIRNSWGKGEIQNGMFHDDGPGWDRYPEIKEALNPVVADDGIFYVTDQEFFRYFSNIYLCAHDMTKYIGH